MRYNLRAPCASCPFRDDQPGYLRYERREEIADGLARGASFACHKTLDYSSGEPQETPRSQHCAGALIVMEREGRPPGQLARIFMRLGSYDPDALDMDAPVFDSLDEWIEQADC